MQYLVRDEKYSRDWDSCKPREILVYGISANMYRSACGARLIKFKSLFLKIGQFGLKSPDIYNLIRVRIGPPYPFECNKRRLNGDPWGSGLE
jgi:hypothetical protein